MEKGKGSCFMCKAGKLLLALGAVALLVLAAQSVFAGTATNTGLESLYTEVGGWLLGAPGKILALGFIVCGVWCARQGSFLMFFGCLLLAIVLTIVPSIVDAKFTALF